jgi:hypothetical protein
MVSSQALTLVIHKDYFLEGFFVDHMVMFLVKKQCYVRMKEVAVSTLPLSV